MTDHILDDPELENSPPPPPALEPLDWFERTWRKLEAEAAAGDDDAKILLQWAAV